MARTATQKAESMPNNELVYLKKSNQFVTAKYKSSLLGNKLIAVSLTKLEVDGEQMKSVLYPHEIKSILGKVNDTNIYRQLKHASQNLAGHILTIENQDRSGFKTFSLITNVDYKDRKLEITYNKEMTPYINSLTSNYTLFELATLVSFDRVSSYRLYEILKKESYILKKKNLPYISKTYGLSELKAMLGLINTDAPYIKMAIDAGKSWDDIVLNIAKKTDRQFDSWSDFRKRVLEVAQEEMNRKADICFDYTTERAGHGGKVVSVRFLIKPNTPTETSKEKVSSTYDRIAEVNPEYVNVRHNESELDIQDVDVFDYTSYEEIKSCLKDAGIKRLKPFDKQYFERVYKASGHNLDIIKSEIEYSKTVPHIRNYFGWLLKAVEDRYSENTPVEALNGSTERADYVNEINAQIRAGGSDLKKDIWNRYKTKPEFEKFIADCDIPVDELESMYSYDELVRLFIQYKKEHAEELMFI